MLVMALLVRWLGLSPASVVADDLALLVSGLLVVVGLAYARFGRS